MDSNLAAAVLIERVIRSAYAARRSEDVQPLQWSILRYLGKSPDKSRSLASVAQYVGVTPAPASRAVQTLQNRGLVSKCQNPENLRATSISITSKGLGVLEEDPLLRIASALSKLPEAKNRDFLRTLRDLVLHFENEYDIDEEKGTVG